VLWGRRAQAVRAIFAAVQPAHQQALVEWLSTFGRHAKVPYRAMALDVAAALLALAATVPATRLAPLLDLVLARVHDKMPSVRARALAALLSVLADGAPATLPWADVVITSVLTDTSRTCHVRLYVGSAH
jgi:hypothetical protein